MEETAHAKRPTRSEIPSTLMIDVKDGSLPIVDLAQLPGYLDLTRTAAVRWGERHLAGEVEAVRITGLLSSYNEIAIAVNTNNVPVEFTREKLEDARDHFRRQAPQYVTRITQADTIEHMTPVMKPLFDA